MSSTTEALKLDVSIIEALLSRNRPSHGRAIYYKRMQMVMQCICKCRLIDFASLLKNRLRQESKCLDRQSSGGELPVDEDLQYLSVTLSNSFPDLVSRIEHAAKAFFTEIGRGFFLPYCTVAVSALARIRILVLQMGHEGIVEMHKVGVDLSHRLPHYVVDDERDKQAAVDTNHLKLLCKSLGIAWKDKDVMMKRGDSNDNASTERIPHGEDSKPSTERIPQSELGEALAPPSQISKNGDSESEDIGLHVGMVHKNTVVESQSERADHNFEVMKHMKPILSNTRKERKRKLDKCESKRVKGKESIKKTKKRKDFFDEIFGDK